MLRVQFLYAAIALGVAFGGGFLFGATFDVEARPDWAAWGTLATFSAVLVALLPIYRDWISRGHRKRSTRMAAIQHLSVIRAALDFRLPSGQYDSPFHAEELRALADLNALSNQFELLDVAEVGEIMIATQKFKLLAMTDRRASASPGLFQDAKESVEGAIKTLSGRLGDQGPHGSAK